MRGGALGVFVTNTKPDMRSLRAQSVYHGLDGLLGHYGLRLNRDIVVDRKQNGVMNFPVRQGNAIRTVQINYPLIPTTALLKKEALVMRGVDLLTLPFISSIDLMELPVGVNSEVWAKNMSDGSVVALLVNLDDATTQDLTASWAQLGLTAGTKVAARDLWLRQDIGVLASNNSFTAKAVPPHGGVMIKLTVSAPQ